MTRRVHVVGLGGSLRAGSTTTQVLEIALEGAAQAGAATMLLDLAELDLPIYREGLPENELPGSAVRLLETVRSVDGLVLATPVYHGTPSGAIKNALDYLEYLAADDPPWLEGKLVGLISVSRGMPGINAINTLDYACRALRAWTLPLTVAVARGSFVGDRLREGVVERLVELGAQVASSAPISRNGVGPAARATAPQA
jgi:FMN reductase